MFGTDVSSDKFGRTMRTCGTVLFADEPTLFCELYCPPTWNGRFGCEYEYPGPELTGKGRFIPEGGPTVAKGML
jgi:hypothetical protein